MDKPDQKEETTMNMKTTKAPKIAIGLISPILSLILLLFLSFDSHAQ